MFTQAVLIFYCLENCKNKTQGYKAIPTKHYTRDRPDRKY